MPSSSVTADIGTIVDFTVMTCFFKLIAVIGQKLACNRANVATFGTHTLWKSNIAKKHLLVVDHVPIVNTMFPLLCVSTGGYMVTTIREKKQTSRTCPVSGLLLFFWISTLTTP